ncbi:MAG: endonuclease Q family protein [bacterium]
MLADFHLHSKYSRATSPEMGLEGIYRGAKLKGIDLVGTGDFTHPKYFQEIQEKLISDASGLFSLQPEIATKIDEELPESVRNRSVKFILSVEISNIYKKNDKVRKSHNLILCEDFVTAGKLIAKLNKIGNLKSDGRPILGLSAKDLLAITLEIGSGLYFIPAHIWTPWFSVFGSRSGYDSLEECFAELTPFIRTLETGLSSDPYMNWRWSEIADLCFISNSDAHSAAKMGREANILDCEPDFQEIIAALKTNDERFVGTIEFFPEEGKYYLDGHRSCGVSLHYAETKKLKGICPQCGKALVLGVSYRVAELAERSADYRPTKHKSVEYIVPLAEIIAEIMGLKSANSTKVVSYYDKLISKFGSEFEILRSVATQDLEKLGEIQLAEALNNLRSGKVFVQGGYDGIFGVIRVLQQKGNASQREQLALV